MLFCLFAVLLWTGVSLAGTEVTTCGQVVSGSAFLSGDLDCSSAGTDAVVLDGGTLDLRGFTITGDSLFGTCGIRCTRSCKLTSDPPGGTITGWIDGVCDDPFDADLVRAIRVRDVLIAGNSSEGICAREAAVRVIDSTITNNGKGLGAARSAVIRDSVISGNATSGVGTSGRLTVKNSQIFGNGTSGVGGGGKNRIIDSTITGNGAEGIFLGGASDRLRVLRSTIDGNGSDGIFTDAVPTLIRDSTITNNGGDGIDHDTSGQPLKVVGTTVTGNAFHGVAILGFGFGGCDLRMVDSTITGNGTDPSCGVTVTCADVAACAFPSLKTTICETSYDTDSGFPGTSWGVCSLD